MYTSSRLFQIITNANRNHNCVNNRNHPKIIPDLVRVTGYNVLNQFYGHIVRVLVDHVVRQPVIDQFAYILVDFHDLRKQSVR